MKQRHIIFIVLLTMSSAMFFDCEGMGELFHGPKPIDPPVTVTFNANGSSGTAPTAQTVAAGSVIYLPNSSGLSKSGYTFGDWNTNPSGTGDNFSAGSSYTVTGNITLYAKWNVVLYTVTFNANGASGTAPSAQTVNADTVISLPNKGGLIIEGNIFIGWSESSSGNSTIYSIGDSIIITGNMVFFAQWVPANPPPDTPTDLEWSLYRRYGQPPVIYLNWSSVPGATGYYIYRSLSASGPYTKVGLSATNSYEDTELFESISDYHYYYKISAYNDTGESSQSSYVEALISEEGLHGPGKGGVIILVRCNYAGSWTYFLS